MVWVDPKSLRGYIERNAIAMLSNYCYRDEPIGPPICGWLGHCAKSKKVRLSGLWNVDDVERGIESLRMGSA